MRAAAITSDGEVTIVEQPRPVAAGDLVTVQILIAPMCTEFKLRRTANQVDTLGHEAVGVVKDAGASKLVRPGDVVVVMPGNACGVCELCRAGDHIYCRQQRDVLTESGSRYGSATFADEIVKPDWLLVPVPDDVPLRHAGLTICALGPGFNAVERCRVGADDVVLISGAGPVGLGALVQARARGAEVHVWEPNPYRRALAMALGAASAAEPPPSNVIEALGGRQADVAVETSGHPEAPSRLLDALRPLGRLAVVAWGAPVSLPPLVPTGVTIYACWHWNHSRFATAMWQVVRDHSDVLDTLVTHEFSLDEVADAMDVQDSGDCGKVLLFTNPNQMEAYR